MVSLEKHESCVGVGRGVAASKSSFLSALQTSQVLLDLDEQTADVRTNAPDIFNAVVEMLSNEKFPLTLQLVLTFHKCARWEYEPTQIICLAEMS